LIVSDCFAVLHRFAGRAGLASRCARNIDLRRQSSATSAGSAEVSLVEL
jgi:hypothetical protein